MNEQHAVLGFQQGPPAFNRLAVIQQVFGGNLPSTWTCSWYLGRYGSHQLVKKTNTNYMPLLLLCLFLPPPTIAVGISLLITNNVGRERLGVYITGETLEENFFPKKIQMESILLLLILIKDFRAEHFSWLKYRLRIIWDIPLLMFHWCLVIIYDIYFSLDVAKYSCCLDSQQLVPTDERCARMEEGWEEERDFWFRLFWNTSLSTALPSLLIYVELSINSLNSSHNYFHSRETTLFLFLQNNLKYQMWALASNITWSLWLALHGVLLWNPMPQAWDLPSFPTWPTKESPYSYQRAWPHKVSSSWTCMYTRITGETYKYINVCVLPRTKRLWFNWHGEEKGFSGH